MNLSVRPTLQHYASPKTTIRYLVVTGFIWLLSFAAPSKAQDRPLGLGLIIGSPSGFSTNYWLDNRRSVDFGLGWALDDDNGTQLHGDYLLYNFNVISEPRTPIYYGAGIRIGLHGEDSGLGIRFPLGLVHLIREAPMEVFVEMTPIVQLTPDVYLDMQGGFGVRFKLKPSSPKPPVDE